MKFKEFLELITFSIQFENNNYSKPLFNFKFPETKNNVFLFNVKKFIIDKIEEICRNNFQLKEWSLSSLDQIAFDEFAAKIRKDVELSIFLHRSQRIYILSKLQPLEFAKVLVTIQDEINLIKIML